MITTKTLLNISFSKLKTIFTPISICLLCACGESESVPDVLGAENSAEQAEIAVLRSQLEVLKAQTQRVKDSNDIKRLQRAYGYYMDEALWEEVADLFSEHASIEIARDGVYQGQDRIREYLYQFGGGQSGLVEGQLREQYQLMPVVTLSDDGMSAKARWRTVMLVGQFGESALWGEGPYENEYVKEDGIWKISKLLWFQSIMVDYEGGWAANEDANGGIYVSNQLPPDAPPTSNYGTWPETYLPAFHFSNPVGTYLPDALVNELNEAGEVDGADGIDGVAE